MNMKVEKIAPESAKAIAMITALANLRAHSKASIDFTMNVWAHMTDIEARAAAQKDLDDSYGYRHGWYRVGDFCFSREELTGEKYDITQGGWAHL